MGSPGAPGRARRAGGSEARSWEAKGPEPQTLESKFDPCRGLMHPPGFLARGLGVWGAAPEPQTLRARQVLRETNMTLVSFMMLVSAQSRKSGQFLPGQPRGQVTSPPNQPGTGAAERLPVLKRGQAERESACASVCLSIYPCWRE